MVAGHRAIAAVMLRLRFPHAIHNRHHDLHRRVVEFLFHGVGAVVAGTALDDLHGGVGNQRQGFSGLLADVLHALVACGVIGNFAEGLLEVRFEFAFLVAQHQIFERVEERIPHLLHVGIVGEHQRQFLLEHQHAGGNQCSQVPSFIDEFGKYRDVRFLGFCNRIQIAQFQLGHAAAAFLFRQCNRNAVMLEHRDKVFARSRLVAVHVTGGEQRDFSPGDSGRHRLRRTSVPRKAAAQRVAVEFRQPRIGVNAGDGLQTLACNTDLVDGIHDLSHDRYTSQTADSISAGQYPVTQLHVAFLVFNRLGSEHQMGKIHVPFMRRNIGTLGHVA